MQIIDIILKNIPIPIKMKKLTHRLPGVLGYLTDDTPTASIPAWKPYLNGDKYMMG